LLLEQEILRDHRSHATGATQLRGHDGQVKQCEQEVLHARDSVGQTSGATQRYLNPGFSERMGIRDALALEMHTILVIALGLGLLGLCALVGRMLGGTSGIATAALAFLPLWLVGAGINMYIGVKRAGYSVAAESPIFLIVFGLPAAVALFAWTKLR
jgi:hypothetical protein